MFISKNYLILIPLYVLKTEFNIENPVVSLSDVIQYAKAINSIFLENQVNSTIDITLSDFEKNFLKSVTDSFKYLDYVNLDVTISLDDNVDMNDLEKELYNNVPLRYYEILSNEKIINHYFVSKKKVYSI